MTQYQFESAIPNPSYLIKSISEQGYKLETAIADLIDNSIAADARRVELLVAMDDEPFSLFLADDGKGMSEAVLKSSMQFPSSSPDRSRQVDDLGRFGLGLKTASFSQTRAFTVLSKQRGSTKFLGRTWDVDALESGEWRLIVESAESISSLLDSYRQVSDQYLSPFEEFQPNTIVIWRGLRKFEDYLREGNRRSALRREVSEVTADHLSLVFHRFLEDKNKPLSIRLNNKRLKPFSPFPTHFPDVRKLQGRHRKFNDDVIRLDAIVLPARAIDESSSVANPWTSRSRSLTDMEGMYVYRQRRLISHGGWNGVIRKAQKHQLARLKVELGNQADHLLHLNVAKSQVTVPHDLQEAFEDYVGVLCEEAKREFYNRGIRKFSGEKKAEETLLKRVASHRGSVLEVNEKFPPFASLHETLDANQKSQLRMLMRLMQTALNKTKQAHEDVSFLDEESNGVSPLDLRAAIKSYLDFGSSPRFIKRYVLPELGFHMDSLPADVLDLLEE